MTFESLSPYERGWFLGQIDEIFSDDYDKNLFDALWKMSGSFDTNVLYAEDRTRRAVVRFADKYVEAAVQEAGRQGIEVAPDSIARVAATMCCFIGLAAGMNAQTEEYEDV